jgi:cytochrome c-type biogenesis protein CcmF
MNVDSGTIDIAVTGVRTAPVDWIVVQAYEKPLITLVWIGFILLTLGFGISIFRRQEEQRYASKRADEEAASIGAT